MEDATSLAQPSTKRVPTLLKVYAVILIIVSVLAIPLAALTAVVLPQVQVESHYGVTSIVIIAVSLVLSLAEAVIGIILGANLLRNNRRSARRAIEFLIVADLAIILCDIMISGLSGISVAMVVRLAFYIALMVYIDPSLAEERQAERKLSDMETRERAELGTLGRDESGKGYIELDFFNLFWIFMVCCVLGLLIEAVYHMVVVDPGVYQNRAGMLYGPFSPIYGFGAVLMTLALNRFYNKNIVLIFLMSAVIGGAFEYFVSLVHAVRVRHRGLGLLGHVPKHRRTHQRHVHGHVGRAWLRVDQVLPAPHAQGGKQDSVELALYRDHHLHGAHASQRRHDPAFA